MEPGLDALDSRYKIILCWSTVDAVLRQFNHRLPFVLVNGIPGRGRVRHIPHGVGVFDEGLVPLKILGYDDEALFGGDNLDCSEGVVGACVNTYNDLMS